MPVSSPSAHSHRLHGETRHTGYFRKEHIHFIKDGEAPWVSIRPRATEEEAGGNTSLDRQRFAP